MMPAAVLALFCLLLTAELLRERRKNRRLRKLLAALKHPTAASVVFYALIDGVKIRIRDMKQMSIGQLIPILVEFFDKNDQPAQAENLKFGVTDESVAQIVDLDGKPHAKALKAGSFKVNLVADGRVGEGEFPISGESEEVIVLPLDAVKVALKLESPIDAPVVEEPAPEEPAPEEPAPVEEAKAAKKKK